MVFGLKTGMDFEPFGLKLGMVIGTLRAEPLLFLFALVGTKHMYRKKRFCLQGGLSGEHSQKLINLFFFPPTGPSNW